MKLHVTDPFTGEGRYYEIEGTEAEITITTRIISDLISRNPKDSLGAIKIRKIPCRCNHMVDQALNAYLYRNIPPTNEF